MWRKVCETLWYEQLEVRSVQLITQRAFVYVHENRKKTMKIYVFCRFVYVSTERRFFKGTGHRFSSSTRPTRLKNIHIAWITMDFQKLEAAILDFQIYS